MQNSHVTREHVSLLQYVLEEKGCVSYEDPLYVRTSQEIKMPRKSRRQALIKEIHKHTGVWFCYFEKSKLNYFYLCYIYIYMCVRCE